MNKREQGFSKVHVMGNNVWEQTEVIHCIEREIKFVKVVDVTRRNEDVVWNIVDGRLYLVIIFSIAPDELTLPTSEDDDAAINLNDVSRRFIKDTNELCKEIRRKYEGDVYRLILVPDGRLTPYPLALVAEQWNDEGLGNIINIHLFIRIYIWYS